MIVKFSCIYDSLLQLSKPCHAKNDISETYHSSICINIQRESWVRYVYALRPSQMTFYESTEIDTGVSAHIYNLIRTAEIDNRHAACMQLHTNWAMKWENMFMDMRTTNAQIRLRRCAVWSVPFFSLSIWHKIRPAMYKVKPRLRSWMDTFRAHLVAVTEGGFSGDEETGSW